MVFYTCASSLLRARPRQVDRQGQPYYTRGDASHRRLTITSYKIAGLMNTPAPPLPYGRGHRALEIASITFVFGSLEGWVDAHGHQRFQTAYVETGKGTAKTPSAAAHTLCA